MHAKVIQSGEVKFMNKLNRLNIYAKENDFQGLAIYGVAGIFSLIEKNIADYLRQYDLSPAKFNALMVIKHHSKENGISQIEIGDRLLVTASNMTRLVDKLFTDGFIERFAQEGDRRVNLIKITTKGSDLLDKVWPDYYSLISRMTGILSNNELEKLSGILSKWFDELESFN